MRNLLLILLIIISFELNAQTNGGVLDPNSGALEKKPIPYTYLREADVMWSKRIWRKVDLREKINHIFYYPTTPVDGRISFMQAVYNGIVLHGTLTAYADNNEGEFTSIISKEELVQKLNWRDTISIENPDGTNDDKIVTNNFDPSKVMEFKIKEDVFFDKQRSILEYRIIGIAPVMEQEKNGEIRKETLFWIYFPEARHVFANTLVYNRNNDAERRNYDEIFWMRQFGSYIYKESNVYDRKILEFRQGIDELLEAERVKNDIFNYEHDLWEF